MHDIESKIIAYSDLSAEERAAVEAYVADHPELAELLEEAKVLDVLLEEASVLFRDPPDDETLAYYVVTQRLSGHATPPPAIATVLARIEVYLKEHPEARAACEAHAQRLDELEAVSDPEGQFERLTGLAAADLDALGLEERTGDEGDAAADLPNHLRSLL